MPSPSLPPGSPAYCAQCEEQERVRDIEERQRLQVVDEDEDESCYHCKSALEP